MRFGVHLLNAFGNFSVLVDHVGDPRGVFVLGTFDRLIRLGNLPVDIAKKRKRKLVLLGKRFVILFIVQAHAQNRRIFFSILVRLVPKSLPFHGASRGIGFREKPQDHFFALKILQTDRVPLMVLDRKIRCLSTDVKHKLPPVIWVLMNLMELEWKQRRYFLDARPGPRKQKSDSTDPF